MLLVFYAAVAGLIIEATSEMVLAGNPPLLACSLISSSFAAL